MSSIQNIVCTVLYLSMYIVCLLMVQGKLQSFLNVAAHTLESFLKSLDDNMKAQTEDHSSHEYQFVLALVGTITSKYSSTFGIEACIYSLVTLQQCMAEETGTWS